MSNMLWISALSLVCLISHAVLQRNFSEPGIVHAGVWFIVSLAYTIFQVHLDVVSPATLLNLCVGIAMFSIGLHIGIRQNFLSRGAAKGQALLPQLPAVIVLISAAGLTAMAWKALQYVPIQPGMQWFGASGSWYGMLRDVLIAQHGGSYGIASYSLSLCFAGVAYLIIDYRRGGGSQWLWPVLVIALGFALLATGRTFLLLLICMVLGALLPGARVRKSFLILLFPVVVSLVFLPIAFLGGRFSMETLSESIMRYSLAPISAYDYLVNAGMISTDGAMTFRTLFAVLKTLGFPVVQVPDLVQPWAPTRIPGNVYTVFSPYYRDFGLVGVLGFMGMLGVVHGWMFRHLRTGRPVIIVANAILFYALLMQFFQDQYFSLLSQWVQIIFWVYLFNRLRPIANDRMYDFQ